MLRHGRKAAYRRFDFPKRCSPHRTRDSTDGSPAFRGRIHPQTPKTAQKKRVFPKHLLSPRGTRAAGHRVPTHTMLRAALKHAGTRIGALCYSVPTHTMLRAALKLGRVEIAGTNFAVPTHTMLRAALKHIFGLGKCAKTHVPTHTMLRAVLTTKRLCVSTSVTQSRFHMRKAHSNP